MMTRISLTVCCAVFFLCAPASAQRRGVNQGPTVVPIELSERGHVFLQARVNNSEPLWFVLDSGSGDTVLNQRLIQKLNLKIEAEGEVEGAGGEQAAVLTSGVTLDINGVRLARQEIPALDFAALEKSIGREINGMLGYDFMRRFVVEVDYEALVLRIHNAAAYRYRGRGQILPITTENDHPHVRLTVSVAGHEALAGKFIVDGGAGGVTLEFANSFVQAHKLLESVEILETKSLAALGGTHTISYGRGQSIQLGRLKLLSPILGFSRTAHRTSNRRNIAGLIGTRFLRRFTVIYDDKRRRIIFEPNRNFGQPE